MDSGKKIVAQLIRCLQDHGNEKIVTSRAVAQGLTFRFDVADFGKFSTVFRRIEVASGKSFSALELEARTARLQEKLGSYLQELEALEFDAESSRVQLRSAHTGSDKEDFSYFEVMADGKGRISIEKFRYDRLARKKLKADFSFTNERLTGLVTNLLSI